MLSPQRGEFDARRLYHLLHLLDMVVHSREFYRGIAVEDFIQRIPQLNHSQHQGRAVFATTK